MQRQSVDKSPAIVILSGAKDRDVPEILRFAQDGGRRNIRSIDRLSVRQFSLFAAPLACLMACAPQVVQHSGRQPDLFDKESDRFAGNGRSPDPVSTAPELFVRRKDTKVLPTLKPNESGSLFNPDDARNYLFASAGPHNVGRFLDITVAANRGPQKAADKKDEPSAEGVKDAKTADKIEEELLKALPDLTPAEKGDPSLINDFKMKIVHRYDNGDVLAMTTRRSIVDGQGKEITVQARVPYDRLSTGDALTTDDLLDVNYLESDGTELAERRSSGWEDEYSLRLSGFDEAKSKAAQELDDKRKQLEEARGKLDGQIKTFSDERKTVAKQREDLAKKEGEQTAKVEELEGKVKEQQSTIEGQEQQIKDLAPQDKPGDKKDGSNG